jgi:hypothetical protein
MELISQNNQINGIDICENLRSKKVLLSTAYLAPVDYYFLLNNASAVILEQYEYYEKQSYRNRCTILTANGKMDLNIPVEKAGKTIIRDIRISEHGNWQSLHWKALESAYSSSPFFEYYSDDLRPFYEKKFNYLFEFNNLIQQKILELIDIQPVVNCSISYESKTSVAVSDFRTLIHPKKEPLLDLPSYYQVFETKNGFIKNASIVDVLFNLGPESLLYLESSKKRTR